MTQIVFKATLVGASPLIMHSSALIDPLNPIARKLQTYHDKKKKTAEGHAAIADLEFEGALWLSEDRPVVPARALEAALREAAKSFSASPRAQSAFMVLNDAPMWYLGPATVAALVADHSFRQRASVVVDGVRVIRTRPKFDTWSVDVEIAYDPHWIDRDDLCAYLEHAGTAVGLGEGRPRFGRFNVAS